MQTRHFLTLCGALLLPGIAAQARPIEGKTHVLKTFKVSGEGGWDYLSLDADSRRLYITRGTHVMVLNADSGKVLADITDQKGVHGVAVVPKLHRGFISNGGDDSVTVFDLKTFKKRDKIRVGGKPDAILFEPVTGQVFTFNAGSKDTTAIDAATGKVTGTIALGGKPEFAVSDEKGTVFVNIEDTSEIVAFDAKERTVLHRWPIAPGEEPSGLAFDRKTRRLFAVCGNEKMVVLNADTGQVVATPTIGKGPDAAAFDPETSRIYSSNGEDGTLTVIKETSDDLFNPIETVKTQAGARTMIMDTKTHHVYLFTAKVLPPKPGEAAGNRRRGYEPGTFVVLVVGVK